MLISFTSTPIEIPVSDRVSGDTVIKQKATFVSLYHCQENGESKASIDVIVKLYGVSGDTYGAELQGPGFFPYRVTLVADNRTIVNAQTGEIKAIRQFETDEEWIAKAEGFDEPVMFQGDFFEMLRGMDIKISDLIQANIVHANEMNKFK